MLEIIKTADGSNTIYNSEVGENYHSRNGALQESRHVFLNSGLRYFLDRDTSPTQPPPEGGAFERSRKLSVLEVGFGTGLNFLLSADYCAAHEINMDYTGIEAYRLTADMIERTGYHEYISPGIWNSFIKNYNVLLNSQVEIIPGCQLQIAGCELLNFQSEKQFDVIYFDAFASARQPEMWDEAAITHTLMFLKPGGVFVTYAITGNLKRQLKSLGCKVEKAPGAPGKREMLRAVKPL